MTTTDQLPSLTFQSSGLPPSPVAAQKSWSAGARARSRASCGRSARRGRRRSRSGSRARCRAGRRRRRGCGRCRRRPACVGVDVTRILPSAPRDAVDVEVVGGDRRRWRWRCARWWSCSSRRPAWTSPTCRPAPASAAMAESRRIEPAGDDRGEAAAGERGSGGGRGHAAQGRTGGRRARGSATCVHFGGSPPGGFGFRNTVGDDAPPPALHAPRPGGRRGGDRHRRAAAHRAQPRPARRRRRAAGPAAVARRVGRLRRRGADPRPRGDLLPGRDRQRDRRPGVRLLGRVPDRAASRGSRQG